MTKTTIAASSAFGVAALIGIGAVSMSFLSTRGMPSAENTSQISPAMDVSMHAAAPSDTTPPLPYNDALVQEMLSTLSAFSGSTLLPCTVSGTLRLPFTGEPETLTGAVAIPCLPFGMRPQPTPWTTVITDPPKPASGSGTPKPPRMPTTLPGNTDEGEEENLSHLYPIRQVKTTQRGETSFDEFMGPRHSRSHWEMRIGDEIFAEDYVQVGGTWYERPEGLDGWVLMTGPPKGNSDYEAVFRPFPLYAVDGKDAYGLWYVGDAPCPTSGGACEKYTSVINDQYWFDKKTNLIDTAIEPLGTGGMGGETYRFWYNAPTVAPIVVPEGARTYREVILDAAQRDGAREDTLQAIEEEIQRHDFPWLSR